jgi:hypothetical protein
MKTSIIALLLLSCVNFLKAQNPTVTMLSPFSLCEGEVLTINGLNFDPFCSGGNNNNRRVVINGVAITSFVSWSNSQIRVTVPTGVTSSQFIGGVSVRNKCNNTGSGGTTTIYDKPSPPISLTATKTTIECGESTTLFVGGTSGFTNWYANSCGGTVIATGIVSESFSPTTTTTYYVANRSVGPGNCISECRSITITVIPCTNTPPSIVSQSNNQTACQGQNLQLTVSASGSPPPTYQWRFNGMNINGANSSTYNINQIQTTQAGTYDVVITNAAGSVISSPINVTVNPSPSVTIAPQNPVICAGESVQLTASGANFYSWSPSLGLSSSNQAITTASPANTITYIVSGGNGTCFSQASVQVTVNPAPEISFEPANPVNCDAEGVIISASGANNYSWSPSNGLSATSGSSVTANPSQTTEYTITASVGNCSSTKQVVVEATNTPIASFDYQLNENFNVSFINNSQGATSVLWDFGNGNTSTELNPMHSFGQNGIFEVTLIVQNVCGADTFKLNVDVKGLNVLNLGELDIKIYPQPAHNLLFVELPTPITHQLTQLLIYDLSGRTVFSKSVNSFTETTYALDLSGIDNGIYVLRILLNNKIYQSKLIKAAE